FSSRRRHTRFSRDWSSDVCSSDLHGCGDRVSQRSDRRAEMTSHLRVLDGRSQRARHLVPGAGEHSKGVADIVLGWGFLVRDAVVQVTETSAELTDLLAGAVPGVFR